MKKTLFAALLVVTLTACASAPPTTDIQSTAIAIVQTGIALTQTALPISTPPSLTATIVLPTPSLVPTLPLPPILTPDAIQVERWKEYQTELAKLVLSVNGKDAFPFYELALCEWDIFGQPDQEVYVWAECIAPGVAGRKPAVIYLETDGSIRKVKVAGYKGEFYDLDLFPVDVQEKLKLYWSSSRPSEIVTHLNYRETNPETPPLVILSAMPIASPIP